MRTVKEEQLVKALSEMEALAKGVSPGMSGKGNKMPNTTAEANGGLSDEGDKQELAAKSDAADEDEDFEAEVQKASKKSKGKGKGKTLLDWAKEETEEEAHKAMPDDESDESESSDESEDSEPPVAKCKKGISQKSDLADLIKSDANAGPVIDVSPFIESLVDNVSEAEHDLRKAIIEMHGEQATHNQGVRKSLVAIGNLLLDVNKRLNGLMDAPTGERRSVLSKSEVVERFEEEQPDFSKSQILDAMVDLVQKGKINPIDVSRYETTNSIDPTTWQVVSDHLTKSAN